MIRTTFVSLLLVLTALFIGCEGLMSSMGVSVEVTKLWQQYPDPWTEDVAKQAAEAAKAALETNGDDVQLHMYYQDRMKTVDVQALRDEYKQHLEATPNDAHAILLEARVAGSRSHMAEQMDKALELAPDDPYVLAQAAMANAQKRPADTNTAMELADQAIKAAPAYAWSHFVKAYVLDKLKKHEEALEIALNAQKLAPYEFGIVDLAADQYIQLERNDEAKTLLETYYNDHPLHPNAVYSLDHFYKMTGNLEDRIRINRAYVTQVPDPYNYLDLASLFMETDQIDSMFKYLNEAVKLEFFDYKLLARYTEGEKQDEIHADSRYLELEKKMKEGQKSSRESRKEAALLDKVEIQAPDLEGLNLKGKVLFIGGFQRQGCGPGFLGYLVRSL